MDFIFEPEKIETKSFEIIGGHLDFSLLPEQNINVVKRVIHTTADFEYAENLAFSENAVLTAKELLKVGASIVTDTQMAMAGINKKSAARLNCTIDCFINNDFVVREAKEKGTTRAAVAVDYAVDNVKHPIFFVVGNAPTALITLYNCIKERRVKPGFIIGAPVGFVNVVESKELIMELDIPYIVAKGRKGGSNVAAAIINALLYEIAGR